ENAGLGKANQARLRPGRVRATLRRAGINPDLARRNKVGNAMEAFNNPLFVRRHTCVSAKPFRNEEVIVPGGTSYASPTISSWKDELRKSHYAIARDNRRGVASVRLSDRGRKPVATGPGFWNVAALAYGTR